MLQVGLDAYVQIQVNVEDTVGSYVSSAIGVCNLCSWKGVDKMALFPEANHSVELLFQLHMCDTA